MCALPVPVALAEVFCMSALCCEIHYATRPLQQILTTSRSHENHESLGPFSKQSLKDKKKNPYEITDSHYRGKQKSNPPITIKHDPAILLRHNR